MNITLPSETENWLRQRVAEGQNESIEQLLDTLVAERRLAELEIEQDDHLWAKPAIDEALASLARGEGSPIGEVAQRLKAELASRKPP